MKFLHIFFSFTSFYRLFLKFFPFATGFGEMWVHIIMFFFRCVDFKLFLIHSQRTYTCGNKQPTSTKKREKLLNHYICPSICDRHINLNDIDNIVQTNYYYISFCLPLRLKISKRKIMKKSWQRVFSCLCKIWFDISFESTNKHTKKIISSHFNRLLDTAYY